MQLSQHQLVETQHRVKARLVTKQLFTYYRGHSSLVDVICKVFIRQERKSQQKQPTYTTARSGHEREKEGYKRVLVQGIPLYQRGIPLSLSVCVCGRPKKQQQKKERPPNGFFEKKAKIETQKKR